MMRLIIQRKIKLCQCCAAYTQLGATQPRIGIGEVDSILRKFIQWCNAMPASFVGVDRSVKDRLCQALKSLLGQTLNIVGALPKPRPARPGKDLLLYNIAGPLTARAGLLAITAASATILNNCLILNSAVWVFDLA